MDSKDATIVDSSVVQGIRARIAKTALMHATHLEPRTLIFLEKHNLLDKPLEKVFSSDLDS